MNDVLLRVDVTAIHIGERLVIAKCIGDPAGDGPGTHDGIQRVFVVQSGADRGGNHIKQSTNDGRARRETGKRGCLRGDFPANFC